MFPPGFARLATTPCLSGLPLNAMTIGIVVVALCRPYRGAQGDDQIDLSRGQFGGQSREPVQHAVCVSLDNREISSLDISQIAQRGDELNDTDVVSCGIVENANGQRECVAELEMGLQGSQPV